MFILQVSSLLIVISQNYFNITVNSFFYTLLIFYFYYCLPQYCSKNRGSMDLAHILMEPVHGPGPRKGSMYQGPCFLLSRFFQGGKIHRNCQDTLIFPPCSRWLDGGLKNINGLLGTGFPSSAACSLRNETTNTPHFLVPWKSFLLNLKHLFPYL